MRSRRPRKREWTPCAGSGEPPAVVTVPERVVRGKRVRARGVCAHCKRRNLSLDASGKRLVPHAPYTPRSWVG